MNPNAASFVPKAEEITKRLEDITINNDFSKKDKETKNAEESDILKNEKTPEEMSSKIQQLSREKEGLVMRGYGKRWIRETPGSSSSSIGQHLQSNEELGFFDAFGTNTPTSSHQPYQAPRLDWTGQNQEANPFPFGIRQKDIWQPPQYQHPPPQYQRPKYPPRMERPPTFTPNYQNLRNNNVHYQHGGIQTQRMGYNPGKNVGMPPTSHNLVRNSSPYPYVSPAPLGEDMTQGHAYQYPPMNQGYPYYQYPPLQYRPVSYDYEHLPMNPSHGYQYSGSDGIMTGQMPQMLRKPSQILEGVPPVSQSLCELVVKQVDFYFSDENLMTDTYLRMEMDSEGWVPISVIADFNRIRSLLSSHQLILDILKQSEIVEVQDAKVRRRDWTSSRT